MNTPISHSPSFSSGAVAELQEVHLQLTAEQLGQQVDLAVRVLRMACLGVPTLDNPALGADHRALLALHALSTAYLALASNTPAVAAIASRLAHGVSCELLRVDEQRCATAH